MEMKTETNMKKDELFTIQRGSFARRNFCELNPLQDVPNLAIPNICK